MTRVIHNTATLNFISPNREHIYGTFSFRAELANPKQWLLPGMFVRVRIATSAPHPGLLVPISAVKQVQERSRVWVVNSENKIEGRYVKVDSADEEMYVIKDGLKKEDRVVVTPGSLTEGKVIEPQLIDLAIPKSSKKEKVQP